MRKSLWILVLLLITIMLVACGNGHNSEAERESDDVALAEALYKHSCADCHGADLTGGYGPALLEIGSDLSEDEILEVIKNGGVRMPGETLKADDAAKVAAWLATLK